MQRSKWMFGIMEVTRIEVRLLEFVGEIQSLRTEGDDPIEELFFSQPNFYYAETKLLINILKLKT